MILPNFFYSQRPAHLELPSFPTRRSSDLPRIDAREPRRQAAVDHRARERVRVGSKQRKERRQPGAGQLPLAVGARSEEHTSELQSRRDLVCRLLLEKKKNRWRFRCTYDCG